MSEWTPREKWPQWLQDADTDGARVRVVSGYVHWHDGIWHGGSWRSGTWHDGIWCDGTWHDGIWCDGTWHDGIWRGGIWCDGTWHDGIWRGGIWRSGTWHDGIWCDGESSIRSRYQPRWDGVHVRIGCKHKTIPEWDAWFAGDEQYETPRDTEAFRLIHAHYQAIRAWVVAMGWHGEAAQ